MTTKQNCMPCSGYIAAPNGRWDFSDADSFCILDWGRVCTPYSLVWYWGNGSWRFTGEDGAEHLFGFEITWGIGDESNATETCVFLDGKAHKLGAVDVESFPKPDGWMKPWRFVSEGGRFDMTMVPFYDHHSDLNIGVMRMHSHQVHGLWSGTVTLGRRHAPPLGTQSPLLRLLRNPLLGGGCAFTGIGGPRVGSPVSLSPPPRSFLWKMDLGRALTPTTHNGN